MKTKIRIMCKWSYDINKIDGFSIDFFPEGWFLFIDDDMGQFFTFRTQDLLSEIDIRRSTQYPLGIKVGIEMLVKAFDKVFRKYVSFYGAKRYEN